MNNKITIMSALIHLFACSFPNHDVHFELRSEQSGQVFFGIMHSPLVQPYLNFKTAETHDKIEIELEIHRKLFQFKIKQDFGLIEFKANGNILNEQDQELLLQGARKLSETLIENKTRDPKLDSTLVGIEYLSRSPLYHPLQDQSFDSTHRQSDRQSVACVKKGEPILAQWSDENDQLNQFLVEVGVDWPDGYDCMGRCGPGCRAFLPSGWTSDCLNHDACSYFNESTRGHWDANCGDEFLEAMDDWFTGIIKGCQG